MVSRLKDIIPGRLHISRRCQWPGAEKEISGDGFFQSGYRRVTGRIGGYELDCKSPDRKRLPRNCKKSSGS